MIHDGLVTQGLAGAGYRGPLTAPGELHMRPLARHDREEAYMYSASSTPKWTANSQHPWSSGRSNRFRMARTTTRSSSCSLEDPESQSSIRPPACLQSYPHCSGRHWTVSMPIQVACKRFSNPNQLSRDTHNYQMIPESV